MPYLDPAKQRAAKQRSRQREMAAGRCIRCPRMNDAPEVNARLCSACRKKDSAEKKIARTATQQRLAEAEAKLATMMAILEQQQTVIRLKHR